MIDLFCGVGTFSLPFADRVGELAGIEIVETSIESAKRNAKDNGISNTYFLAKDARKGIDEVLESFGNPELLLLDPPRSGAGGKVMRKIYSVQTCAHCLCLLQPGHICNGYKSTRTVWLQTDCRPAGGLVPAYGACGMCGAFGFDK